MRRISVKSLSASTKGQESTVTKEQESTVTKQSAGQTFRGHFAKYCQQTSLHGWQYIESENGFFPRIFWSLIVVIVIALAIWVTVWNYQEYSNATTVTSINTTTASLRDIYFPTVAVCNVNQVTQSFLERLQIGRNKKEKDALFDHFMGSGDQLYTKELKEALEGADEEQLISDIYKKLEENFQWTNKSVFIRLSSQDCSDMFIKAEWSSNYSHNFYDAFQSVTDYGTCCLIMPYLDFLNPKTRNIPGNKYTSEDFHKIPSGTKNGIRNGLKLIVDLEGFNYAFFKRGAKGLRMALIDHRDKAVINQDGFYVQTGTETLVSITPTLLNTTANVLSRFTPKERDCYQDNEFDMLYLRRSYGFRYNMNNCLYEAVLENILDICKCIPDFANFKVARELPNCLGRDLDCAHTMLSRFGDENNDGIDMTYALDTSRTRKKCLQRCKIQTVDASSTITAYPNKQTLPLREDFCLIVEKVRRLCEDEYAKISLEDYYELEGWRNVCYLILTQEECSGGEYITEALDGDGDPDLEDFIFRYASDNIVVLKTFIKNPYYTSIIRNEKISLISFVGNTGGLLGLFLGLSLVSLIEAMYHWFSLFTSLCWSMNRVAPKEKVNRVYVLPPVGNDG